jgi:hypothetical protein
MAAPTLAWGEAHLFELPDGQHLYGREFELLPAGTMMAAGAILHGICGVAASVGTDNVARVQADAPPEVYAIRDTSSDELGIYGEEVVEGFRIKQLQAAQD